MQGASVSITIVIVPGGSPWELPRTRVYLGQLTACQLPPPHQTARGTEISRPDHRYELYVSVADATCWPASCSLTQQLKLSASLYLPHKQTCFADPSHLKPNSIKVCLYIEMLTQIWVYILLQKIWLPFKQNGLIKHDSCYLKHLITIESEGVRYGYLVLLYVWHIMYAYPPCVHGGTCYFRTCLFAFLWCYWRWWRTRKRYTGASAHSAQTHSAHAKCSTGCAINICWHTSVLQYRRG